MAVPTKMILGFPRVSGKFTLSTGSWNASYPQSNLQVLPLSYVARTTNAALTSTTITATATVPERVGMVALVRHNVSRTGKVRLRCWAESGKINQLYDSGWVDLWPEVYPYGGLEWEDDAYWTGKYTDDEIAGAVWIWFNRFATTGLMVGAIQIDLDDTLNASGYLQFGYLEIASALEVAVNPSFGLQYGFRWRSQASEAIGGAQYVDRRVKPRTLKGTLEYSPRDEALSKHYERVRQLDMDLPVLVVPFPDETVHYLRTVMLARHVDPGPAARVLAKYDQVPFAWEEIIG